MVEYNILYDLMNVLNIKSFLKTIHFGLTSLLASIVRIKRYTETDSFSLFLLTTKYIPIFHIHSKMESWNSVVKLLYEFN